MRLLFLFWDALGSPGSWNNYPLRTEEHRNARDTGSIDTLGFGVGLLLLSIKGLTTGKCPDRLHLSQTPISWWVLKATFFSQVFIFTNSAAPIGAARAEASSPQLALNNHFLHPVRRNYHSQISPQEAVTLLIPERCPQIMAAQPFLLQFTTGIQRIAFRPWDHL